MNAERWARHSERLRKWAPIDIATWGFAFGGHIEAMLQLAHIRKSPRAGMHRRAVQTLLTDVVFAEQPARLGSSTWRNAERFARNTADICGTRAREYLHHNCGSHIAADRRAP